MPWTFTRFLRAMQSARRTARFVAVVSRLDSEHKLEGVLRIDACAALDTLSVTLVIVGSGDASDEVRAAADQVDHPQLRRRAVLLTGKLHDPRAAYAAADVVVGMGGSALRGMAFEKPVVVLGTDGFACPSNRRLLGISSGTAYTARGQMYDLTATLRRFLSDPALRMSLGAFGHQTVSPDTVWTSHLVIWRASTGPPSTITYRSDQIAG